jgi:threonine/homoserine/homoserine lactone efflux protein
MSEIPIYSGFALVSLLVALSPGPSWACVIASTLGNGRRGGFAAAAGNSTGILCHGAAAVLGLSTILQYSSFAFGVLKYLGAAYLLVLAVQTIARDPVSGGPVFLRQPKAVWRVFGDGVLVNVLNPKISLLMLALVPQFVDPAASNPHAQIAVMGVMHAIIAGVVHIHVVLLSGSLARRFQGSARARRVMRWAMAALFLGLGARLALADRG